MLWCTVWHDMCLMCIFMCLTYVGYLFFCSNYLLYNMILSDFEIGLMFPDNFFSWGIAICFSFLSNRHSLRILLIWRIHLVKASHNAHFPEMLYYDNGFSVSDNFSLWNEAIAFNFWLRSEDSIDVDTKFRFQNKTQIFEANDILISSNLLMSLITWEIYKHVSETILWIVFLWSLESLKSGRVWSIYYSN